eukprot:COSAG01_NODE_44896_length_414_cov_1.320635_1_plen_114_part_10
MHTLAIPQPQSKTFRDKTLELAKQTTTEQRHGTWYWCWRAGAGVVTLVDGVEDIDDLLLRGGGQALPYLHARVLHLARVLLVDALLRVLCFFNDTATTEIYTLAYTLSLADALP